MRWGQHQRHVAEREVCVQDGVCQCQGNWAGGDCSVNPGSGCQPGTERPSPRCVIAQLPVQ